MSAPASDNLVREAMDDWARPVAALDGIERRLHVASKAEALAGIVDDPLAECLAALTRVGGNGSWPATDAGYALAPLDWQALLRDGVPEIEYISAPYLPRGARIWVFGKAGTMKSLWCEHEAARLSRAGVRVSYFSEENPIAEELRRLDRLQPDPACFRLFHRTGMDLTDENWVAAMLAVTRGDDLAVFDSWTDLWSGIEDSNRDVQQFDAQVLKALQRQGVTPIVIHHKGHAQMFGGDRSGNDAGRGASAIGQKADVTLTFKDAGDDRFTIVYGKSRLGGVHVPECGFKVEDTDDGRIEIVECLTPVTQSIAELAEKAVQAVLTVPAGYLTTTMLREALGGSKDHHGAALKQAEMDPRVHVATEQVVAADGVRRRAKVWRPAREGLPL